MTNLCKDLCYIIKEIDDAMISWEDIDDLVQDIEDYRAIIKMYEHKKLLKLIYFVECKETINNKDVVDESPLILEQFIEICDRVSYNELEDNERIVLEKMKVVDINIKKRLMKKKKKKIIYSLKDHIEKLQIFFGFDLCKNILDNEDLYDYLGDVDLNHLNIVSEFLLELDYFIIYEEEKTMINDDDNKNSFLKIKKLCLNILISIFDLLEPLCNYKTPLNTLTACIINQYNAFDIVDIRNKTKKITKKTAYENTLVLDDDYDVDIFNSPLNHEEMKKYIRIGQKYIIMCMNKYYLFYLEEKNNDRNNNNNENRDNNELYTLNDIIFSQKSDNYRIVLYMNDQEKKIKNVQEFDQLVNDINIIYKIYIKS